MAKKTKTKKKNSNYQQTYKYVSIDQLFRKTLCDFRNMPEPREELGEKADVDENLYNTAIEFCRFAGVITEQEKAEMFDGKNHLPMTAEEVSDFTAIPVYQVEKNLFAFKIKTSEDFVRSSMIKLALCDIVAEIIQKAVDEERSVSEEEQRVAAGYINLCYLVGLITDEQSSVIYFSLKQNMPLELPMISSFTGIDVETLKKMME